MPNRTEKKTIYRCEFRFKGELRHTRGEEGLIEFKDGFWLDAFYQYVHIKEDFSKMKFWIPPHNIEYIVKDVKELVNEGEVK